MANVANTVDAIVVGAGIIGATVSKALMDHGLTVVTLDDQRPFAGTAPSGGHLKPSWFGGMKKAEYEPAMNLLADTWGLKEEQFRVWPTPATVTIYRVDTDTVLAHPYTPATVGSVSGIKGPTPSVRTTTYEEYKGRLLILATGAWAAELIPGVRPVAKQGVSFRLRGRLKQPLVKPWAPYKQVVAHQQGLGEIWVGDGSAILQPNWTDLRTQQCLDRCTKTLGLPATSVQKTLVGLRPYLRTGNNPCYLKQLGPVTWVATGAGKSGTIAAGWVARKILDTL